MRFSRCLRYLLTAAVLIGIALHAYGSEADDGEEYRVYEAALAALDPAPNADLLVAIYDRTLDGTCGVQGNNPVLVKGCTFLWIKPDTSAEVEHLLRSRWRKFPKSAWKNFLVRNASSVALHEPIRTPWKHRLFGDNSRTTGGKEQSAAKTAVRPAAEGGNAFADAPAPVPPSADRVIYLSRVGFNSKRTDAILYVLVFSYDNGVAATGDYLRFRAESGEGESRKWVLAGRVNYFSGVKDTLASLAPPPTGAIWKDAALPAMQRTAMKRERK